MKYQNIKKDLAVELSNDRKYSLNEMLSSLFLSFDKSKISVNKLEKYSKGRIILELSLNGVKFNILCFVKNITGAGWSDRPNMKRIQLSLQSDLKDEEKIRYKKYLNVVLGYYNYDNNPIFVCWYAHQYLLNTTMRSCYVDVESLLEGYKDRFVKKKVSNETIWIFTEENFALFLKDYRSYCKEQADRNIQEQKIDTSLYLFKDI